MDAAPWTLDELTTLVDGVLERCGIRQENGQIAECPNARTVRWYQSIGLVRRPEQRGRVAFYGLPHVKELVAIKRLQSQGHSLSDVQATLATLDDAALTTTAALPDDIVEPTPTTATVTAVRTTSFWDDDVAEPPPAPAPIAPVLDDVLAPRTVYDDASGISLVVPAFISADVAREALARVTKELLAAGLPEANTTRDD